MAGVIKVYTAENFPENIRQLAGLMCKNTLTGKVTGDQDIKDEKNQRWLAQPEPMRSQVKSTMLAMLRCPQKSLRSTAALAISAIAAIEIPEKLWNDLVPTLVQGARAGHNTPLKQAALESLGYICENNPDELESQSINILNGIASGLEKAETNTDIKYAAIVALCNSIEFHSNAFKSNEERELVMGLVWSAVEVPAANVQEVAFECMCLIAHHYYNYIGPYVGKIFGYTRLAMTQAPEEVAQQAIEFWSTVCDEEIELMEEIANSTNAGQQPKVAVHHFAKQALQHLVPLLLAQLCKQSPEVNSDDWSPTKAAGACIKLLAETTTDHLVPHVYPFFSKNIGNADWRYRDAAMLAYGSILVGPDRTKMVPVVKANFAEVLKACKDPSPQVQDTAMWTVGQICDEYAETLDANILPPLMNMFLAALLQPLPSMAAHACWGILNLARGIAPDRETSPLSPYFETLVGTLLRTSARDDASESGLQASAYEAINQLIQTAAKNVYPTIQKMLEPLLGRLDQSLKGTHSGEARERQLREQALLCGSMQVMIQKLDDRVLFSVSDRMMKAFLSVMKDGRNSEVHEEALMGISAVAHRVGERFERYMAPFAPMLLATLDSMKDHPYAGKMAVTAVGDVARALNKKLVPFGDELMKRLLASLAHDEVSRDLKPIIICCLGDIAIAVEGYFSRYLQWVMRMLVDAGKIKFPQHDVDDMEYLNALREAILDCYTGLVQGMNSTQMQPYIAEIMAFLVLVAQDPTVTSGVLRSAVGVVWDMADNMPQAMKAAITQHNAGPAFQALIQRASKCPEAQQSAQQAHASLAKLF